MRLSVTSLLVAFLALSASGSASAGWLTKDVPKKLVADPATPTLTFTVPRPMDQVASKLRFVAVGCAGEKRRDEAADAEGVLIVSWLSADTISYIVRLEPSEAATKMIVYMNANVSRQQAGWPKVINEWFVENSDRCISEIMRDA